MNLRRLLLSMVMYGAVAAAVISETYCSLAKFHGTLAVAAGREEKLVVTPSSSPLRPEAGATPQVPPEDISFSDPESAWSVFPKSTNYHTLRLSFSVRLDRIDVVSAPPPENVISLSGPEQSLVQFVEGAEIGIGGASYVVETIRPWSGLIRDPQGMPMAAVTLAAGSRGGGKTILFLAHDVWQRSPDGSVVYFAWHPGDADAARKAGSSPLPGLESARWGVIDRGAINWFQSFTPGTGAFLSSGEEITLVGFDKETPAMVVEIKRNGTIERVRVIANQPAADAPVRFEYPTLSPRVFMIDAWEDGHAIVSAYENGQPAGQKDLPQGQWFYADPAPLNLRLDDVMSSAVVVPESESNLWAAVLKPEAGQEIVLRQGESKRIGDWLVEYKRMRPPSNVNYLLTIDDSQIMLKPGNSIRKAHWRLRHAHDTVPWLREYDPQAVAVLEADYLPGQTLAVWLAFIGLAALALRIGHFAWRIKKRVFSPQSSVLRNRLSGF